MSTYKCAQIAGIGVIAAVAVVSAIYLWHQKTPHQAVSFSTQSIVLSAKQENKAAAKVSTPVGSAAKKVPTSIAYKKSFAESHNYWEFAQSALPAAQAGDADAQFFLSKALKFCEDFYGAYFQPDGNLRTLDEALQYVASLKLPMEYAQSIYDKCQELQRHDVGKAMDWLARATEAGQPAAQATMAVEMLQQQQMRSLLKAGAAPTSLNTVPLVGNGADPSELIHAAVQSKDPEALFYIGVAQALLDPSSDSNTARLAWMLVACERGFDCSATADWVKTLCTRCDTSSPVNMVRSSAGDAWPNVQQRAQEISTKLDAGQWDDLGLGAS